MVIDKRVREALRRGIQIVSVYFHQGSTALIPTNRWASRHFRWADGLAADIGKRWEGQEDASLMNVSSLFNGQNLHPDPVSSCRMGSIGSILPLLQPTPLHIGCSPDRLSNDSDLTVPAFGQFVRVRSECISRQDPLTRECHNAHSSLQVFVASKTHTQNPLPWDFVQVD